MNTTMSKFPLRLVFVSAFSLLMPLHAAEVSEKIAASQKPFFEALWKSRDRYRQNLAALLKEATKAEIYLLDFEVKHSEALESLPGYDLERNLFPIRPYSGSSRILARRFLSAGEIAKLLPPLEAAVGIKKNSGGAFCHFPIHGLRLWSGETFLFETSFCWHCGNFFVKYPDDTASWVGLSGSELQKVVNDLMPIPAKELQRFEEMRNPRTKKTKKK